MNPNEAWSKQSMTAAMQLSTLLLCKARRQLYDACSIDGRVFIDDIQGSAVA